MNCDPNNLSKLSSCIRCLTDAQLAATRTFLLCQWLNKTSGSAPNAPTTLDISDTSSAGTVTLTWTNPSPQGMTTEIWRSTDGVTYSLFTTVAGNLATAKDTSGMPNNSMWFYKIRACNGSSCSAFTSIVSISTNFQPSPFIAVQSFPTLIRETGTFTLDGAAVTSFSAPLLRTVGTNLDLANNAGLTTINLNSLVSTGGALFLGSDNFAGVLSLPALVSTGGDLQVQANAITSLSVPSLKTVGGILSMGSNAFVNQTFPALLSCPNINFPNNAALISMNFPSLTSGQLIDGDGNAGMTTVALPVLIFTDGGTCDFSLCGLLAATVNQVLARGVASGLSFYDFELAGGTNAAPSGQGVIDKATLIGQGNTVNTN